MLSVRDLEASYGALKILHGVDLHVDRGEIVAILGPNGSGKSTTLKCVSGLLQPDKGTIQFNNEAMQHLPAYQRVAHGILMVPQGRRVLGSLTVQENLEIGGFLIKDRELMNDRLINTFKLFPVLQKKRRDLAASLSGGEQQILSLARALMLDPKLLILDEPSLGISPKIVQEILETLLALNNEQGLTLLIVEQNVSLALKVAQRLYVLATGRVRFTGKPSELSQSELKSLYFGHAI